MYINSLKFYKRLMTVIKQYITFYNIQSVIISFNLQFPTLFLYQLFLYHFCSEKMIWVNWKKWQVVGNKGVLILWFSVIFLFLVKKNQSGVGPCTARNGLRANVESQAH